MEELADLLEVMQAVVKARGWTMEELERVRAEKAAKRGGFERKILLKEVKEDYWMDIERAKELLSALADGVDPFTGEILPRNHVCNQPEMIRAFHEVMNALPPTKKKSLPCNAGKPWTEIEEEKLLDEFDSGMKISAIAKEHGRSKGAIESRLADLGKITDTYFGRKPR